MADKKIGLRGKSGPKQDLPHASSQPQEVLQATYEKKEEAAKKKEQEHPFKELTPVVAAYKAFQLLEYPLVTIQIPYI